jgi:hypothetical protein
LSFKLLIGTFAIILLFPLVTVPGDTLLISSTSNLNQTKVNPYDEPNKNNLLGLNILTNGLENRLYGAASILEFASNLSEMKSVPNASLLNATLETMHGIPQSSDSQKRNIAHDIISHYLEIAGIAFIMPNGDTYFMEPYTLQSNQTKNNLAYRDYFKGAIATNNTYLGDIITSTSSGVKRAIIAVPVFSERGNGDLTGILVGSIDLGLLNKELQSFNLSQGQRIVYVDSNDTKIADSDKRLFTNSSESFSSLKSFQNAIEGKFGSIVEKINQDNMLVSYYPMDALQNRWIVLWIQPFSNIGDNSNKSLGE